MDPQVVTTHLCLLHTHLGVHRVQGCVGTVDQSLQIWHKWPTFDLSYGLSGKNINHPQASKSC